MKTRLLLTFVLVCLPLVFSCGKPPAEKKAAAATEPGQVASPSTPSAPMLQLYYRLPANLDLLKTALKPLAGPALPLVWPHIESLKSMSMWVFDPPDPTPGKFTPPRFVFCLSGKATDWLYVAQLQSPDGKPITFAKDQLQPIRGPEGSHPVYYLLDRGQSACLGSTEALTRGAFDWPEPAMAAEGFFLITGNVPSLFSLSTQKDFTAALDSLMALSGVTQQQMMALREFFSRMQEFRLTTELGGKLDCLASLNLVWKESPAFFTAPGKSRIPFTEKTMLDLHLEFDAGRWMGMDLWPMFDPVTPEDLKEKVKKFLVDLQAIDLQSAQLEGGQVAGRLVIRARTQEDFLMEAAEKIMITSSEGDKYSVKTVSKSKELAVFEATPTAVEEPHLRLLLTRLYGGLLRFESRRESGGVVWTFGQWADAPPVALPADNQRIVFAMMPFFNLTLPVFEEAFHKPDPRFTPYPAVPQDPWRFSIRFEPPKKAMVLEMAFPLGAWLKSALDHPEILRRMEALKTPAAPAAPPSDL